MNRLLSTAVVAASLLGGALSAAGQSIKTYSTVLTVDGVACGPVTKWDGGDMRADVIHENGNLGKHGGSAQSAQVSFEVPFPSAKPLMDLIADLCANRTKRVTLVLADVSSGTPEEVHALEVHDAILAEVRFPALPLKDAWRVMLVFQGDHSQTAAIQPPSPSASRRNVVPASFRFEVPGVDLTGVSRVEAFTIKRKVVFDDPGVSGGATLIHAAPTEFPDSILVTLPRERSDGLAAWRDASFAASPGSSGVEKNSTLSLLDGSARTIVTIQFTNLGIKSLSVVPNPGPAPRMMQADFYCEGITITVPEIKAEAAAQRRS